MNCSFCGKGSAPDNHIVAGPAVFICEECVGLCVEILADIKKFHPKPPAEILAKPAHSHRLTMPYSPAKAEDS